MKKTEFRKLIREEIKAVIKENLSKKSLKESAETDFYKYIGGTENEEAAFHNDILDGVEKMPAALKMKWNDLMDDLSRATEASEHIEELTFYVTNKKYFSARLVKMSQDLLNSMA